MSCVNREVLSIVTFCVYSKFSWLYKKCSVYIEYYWVLPRKYDVFQQVLNIHDQRVYVSWSFPGFNINVCVCVCEIELLWGPH